MIRASIQLSPKTKVVAHLVLYNFYFDQILSANVKFRDLDGQSRLKNFELVTLPPLLCWCTAGLDVGASTRRRADVRAPT